MRLAPRLRLTLIWLWAGAALAADPKPEGQEAMVAMRDGVKLATTIYLPEGAGPWPAVMVRTPYNKDGMRGGAGMFTKHGYAVVAQDCRGRFKSEGKYVPFINDREDGYDAIEWAATQPWCDGKLGIWGGSALGITSNQAAAAAPPHLLAAFVIVAPAGWRNEALWINGMYRKEMIDGWMKAQNADEVRKEWNKKAIADPYFDAIETEMKYEDIKIPMYNVGGWYDIFQRGTLKNFAELQRRGGGAAKGNQKVIIGALGHGPFGSRFAKFPNHGDDVGKADAVRWFDHWLKGIDNGIMKEPPVTYFLMGDAETPGAPGNEWRTAASWPPAAETESFYLLPGGALAAKASEGGAESTDAYDYDPKRPAASVGGQNLIAARGPMDQRQIGERADYLRFQSDPLTAPLTVIGPVKAEFWVETDAPDTDFIAKLVDVYPDGYEALILDEGLRLRYRKGNDKEVMMEKGKVEKIEIDMWSTAMVFNKGHRIAVHVTSSADPRFDPNPNTGAAFRSNEETRVAHNVLHHDAAHPSHVLLPVVTEAAGKRDLLKQVF